MHGLRFKNSLVGRTLVLVVLALGAAGLVAQRNAPSVRASGDSQSRLTTISASQLSRRGVVLAQPAGSGVVTRSEAETTALEMWPEGRVRESAIASLQQRPPGIPPEVGDVWLISIEPAAGFPKSIDGSAVATFVLEIIDATTGRRLWRAWGT